MTSILAIQVGNTRVQVGHLDDGRIVSSHRFAKSELPAIVEEAARIWSTIKDGDQPAVLLASVNESIAKPLQSMLEDQLATEVYRLGDDMPVPIGESLDPETIVGIDRLLNAAAAWDTLKQACIVVDAGTAVTVDFVDGEGTFHGGAIAPGLGLQLKALHDYTDALPSIEYRPPSEGAFGRSTAEAMLRGVGEGVRGLVWRLVERYAESYGAYPMVIATGGDAETLFAQDEIVNRIVPDLTLLGMAVAARHALAHDESRDSEPDDTP